MPVTYNSFNPAFSSVILVVSSDEEFVTIEIVEEFAAIEAFELSGEELAVSRSMHFKHGGINSS
jgi:hypothetical protein